MSEAARKPAPVGRLRVAVHAVDLPRRSALSRVVAEALRITGETTTSPWMEGWMRQW